MGIVLRTVIFDRRLNISLVSPFHCIMRRIIGIDCVEDDDGKDFKSTRPLKANKITLLNCVIYYGKLNKNL